MRLFLVVYLCLCLCLGLGAFHPAWADVDLTGDSGVGSLALGWTDADANLHPGVAMEAKPGIRFNDLVAIQLYTTMGLGNWETAGRAYGWLADHSRDYGDPISNFFIWSALLFGYMSAWLTATHV